MLFYIAFAILFIPMAILFPTKVIHKERMPKRGKKCIATSNHYSNVDPILYNKLFVRKFRFMAKKELFNTKFKSFILKGIGAFPVDRENITPSVFKKTIGELNQNHQVFIFPEGTRNKEGSEQMGDAKMGVITFASKGDSEIVPMIIYAKPRVFRKNYVIVGEPFKVVGENPKRLTKEESEENLKIYTKKMEDLRKEIDEFVSSKKRKKNSK